MALNDEIIPMERFSTVTVEDGLGNTVMSLRMAEFIEAITMQVNQNIPAFGSGSPEGVLVAKPNKLYFDTAAAPGSNAYFKKTGTGATGWQLV